MVELATGRSNECPVLVRVLSRREEFRVNAV
jgi:hypothetical protein